MALTTPRPVVCQLNPEKPTIQPQQVQKLRLPELSLPASLDSAKNNIVLQPRLSNLRSYGSDPGGVIKTKTSVDGVEDDVSRFFAALTDYIESSKKSQDFEIISGRFAMIVFAATVSTEVVTGNSVFGKMDLQGIAEAAGACMGAVACAAIFAWFSSARGRVGRIFTVGCNTFIDSLIDQIVDGLFYDSELSDWTDEL